MDTNVVSPFDGGPPTHQTTDERGEPVINVTLAATSPFFAKIADALAVGGSACIGIVAIYAAFVVADTTLFIIGLSLISPVLAWPLLRYVMRFLFRRTINCEFTRFAFTFTGLWGTKRFDRTVPHKFVLYTHKKAAREDQRLSLIERKRGGKWWAWSPRRYYGESHHLAFEYMDQRHDMLVIFGPVTAQAFRNRLKACDDFMLGQERGGNGTALNPEDEWSPQPGSLSAAE